MRPPILFLTVGFGVGPVAGLDPLMFPGGWRVAGWGVVASCVAGCRTGACVRATCAAWRRLVGIMAVRGGCSGQGGRCEREGKRRAQGTWSKERGAGSVKRRMVSLEDPTAASGGVVMRTRLADVRRLGAIALAGGHAARGGTTWWWQEVERR